MTQHFIKERLYLRLPPPLRTLIDDRNNNNNNYDDDDDGDDVLQLIMPDCVVPELLSCLPHRQRGPSCGLAALSMALQCALGRPQQPILDQLLSLARQMGLTKQVGTSAI